MGGGINNDTIEVWVVVFGALICGIVWFPKRETVKGLKWERCFVSTSQMISNAEVVLYRTIHLPW